MTEKVLVPAGRSRTSFVDVRDVGAVAALFRDELGRRIVCRRPSIPHFVRAMRSRGTPWPFILVMVGLYTATCSGAAAQVTDQVERLLGRPPITRRQYIRDYRDCWSRPAG